MLNRWKVSSFAPRSVASAGARGESSPGHGTDSPPLTLVHGEACRPGELPIFLWNIRQMLARCGGSWRWRNDVIRPGGGARDGALGFK